LNSSETSGTAAMLDPRRNAYRPDLASSRLKDKVEAERFTDGTPGQIIFPSVPLRAAPDATFGLETEALFGEALTVYDDANGWAWVQLARDGYVGYVPIGAVRPGPLMAPTHRVQSLATFVHVAPDIKSPPIMHLPMNALLTIAGSSGNFSELQQGGFAVSRHIAALDRPARDFVEVAEWFIGTPYLWGGCTRIGIDCSGLVQTSLLAANIAAPRDSDMQRTELGIDVAVSDDLDELQRGDLVFWRGHVGIMTDGVMIVHANAHHMQTVTEPLPEAANRITKTGGPIIAIKRLVATES
jgi:cell wall-associated NlpC family hydrolase